MVKRGYSLAETLIVIALIMIMAGLFLNSDLPRRKLTIQREAYILSQNIRTMENNAGNARSNTNCNVPNTSRSPNPDGGLYPFDGYAILLEHSNNGQYTIYTNCIESTSFPDQGKNDLGKNIDLTGFEDGSFLFNPIPVNGSVYGFSVTSPSKCNPASEKCDIYDDGRGGKGYINELLAIRKFPSSIKIREAGLTAFVKKESNWGWQECEKIIIDFKPTIPTTYIICKIGNLYYSAREVSIIISDGENNRTVVVNKAGLVATKSDSQ